MTFNYVKPTDLAKDIEFGARRIYMRYGEVIGVTVTNLPINAASSVVNLMIKPYTEEKYSLSTKTYRLNLTQFQQINFRDYLPELYLFTEIHETGNESDFENLSTNDKQELTNELSRSNDLDIAWIQPLEAPFWNNSDSTIPELLRTQFKISTVPTVTNELGVVNFGIIGSVLDSGAETIQFEMDSEMISAGVYYIATTKNPSQKVKYKFNNAVSYSTAEYIGKYNFQFIYKIYTLEPAYLEVLIKHSEVFSAKIFNRNPIITYSI